MLVLNREAGESVEMTGDVSLKVLAIRHEKSHRVIDVKVARPGKPLEKIKALRAGESFQLLDNCLVKVIRFHGREVGIGFDAPAAINIWRSELQQH